MIPHRPVRTPPAGRLGPRPGTFGGVDTLSVRLAAYGMVRTPDRRPRLVALLLVAVLFTGLAATASAAPALPSCKVADTMTK